MGAAASAVLPFLVALTAWMLLCPRTEVVSVGDGRGVGLPDSGAAGATQLLLLVVLVAGASVAATVTVWHGRAALWRPVGVAMVTLVVSLLSALTATAAPQVAAMLLRPDRGAPPGAVVSLPPDAGALYFGPIVPGTTGPVWSALPAGAGWALLGALCATATIALWTYVSASRGLASARAGVIEGDDGRWREGVVPRTGR